MICDSCTTCPHAPLLPLPLCCPLSSSGRRCDGVGRPPPSPGVCETPAPRASGWPPSSTRSSIADRWRWRRRTVQTCRRSEFPGTHRRAGRPARMASLPPTTWGGICSNLTSLMSEPAGLCSVSSWNEKGWANEPQGAARWNSSHPTAHLSLAMRDCGIKWMSLRHYGYPICTPIMQMRKQRAIIAVFYIMMFPSLRIFVLEFCSCYLASVVRIGIFLESITGHLKLWHCDSIAGSNSGEVMSLNFKLYQWFHQNSQTGCRCQSLQNKRLDPVCNFYTELTSFTCPELTVKSVRCPVPTG